MINQTDTDIRTNDVKFKQIYNGLFIGSGKNHKKNQIGAFQIPEDCLTELLEITSLLSDYSGYDE